MQSFPHGGHWKDNNSPPNSQKLPQKGNLEKNQIFLPTDFVFLGQKNGRKLSWLFHNGNKSELVTRSPGLIYLMAGPRISEHLRTQKILL